MKLSVGNNLSKVTDASDEELDWLHDLLAISEPQFRRSGGRARMVGTSQIPLLRPNGTYPSGFNRLIRRKAQAAGYAVDFTDTRVVPDLTTDWSACDWLRDYQKAAVEAIVRRRRGVVHHSTGSGKTAIAVGTIETLKNLRWLFLVQQKDLLDQTVRRYQERASAPVNVIGDGRVEIHEGARLTVATVQTISNRRTEDVMRKLLESTEGLIVDEAHGSAARTVWWVIMHTPNAYIRVGLSVGPETLLLLKCERGGIRTQTIAQLAAELSLTGPGVARPAAATYTRAFDGKTFCWKKVESMIAHQTRNTTYFNIKTAYGRTLAVTGDHSVYRVEPAVPLAHVTKAKGRKPNPGLRAKWLPRLRCVRGSQLKVGDFVLLDTEPFYGELAAQIDVLTLVDRPGYRATAAGIHVPYSSRKPARFVGTADLAYLLGFFIGDGWVNEGKHAGWKSNGARVCFAVERGLLSEFLARIHPLLTALDANAVVREMPRGSVEVRIGSRLLADMITTLGAGTSAETKQLPTIAWKLNQAARNAFIEGLIDSDGCLSSGKQNRVRVYYSTVSKDLATSLQLFLAANGIAAGLSTTPPGLGGVVAGKRIVGRLPHHCVNWSPQSQKGHYGSGRWPEFLVPTFSGVPVRIKSITAAPAPALVYDLQVEGVSNFTANGILVHNSGTPWARGDKRSLLTLGALGPTIHRATATELTDRGYLSKACIEMQEIFQTSECATFQGAYSELVTRSTVRNRRLVELMIRAAKPNLTFVKELSHGKTLTSRASKAGLRVEFVSGQHSTEARRATIERLVRGDLDCIVSSPVFVQGVDIPELRSVVIAAAGKSVIQALQRIGRGMRISAGKTEFQVFDILDVGQDWMQAHARQRQRAYESEGHQVKIVKSQTETEVAR